MIVHFANRERTALARLVDDGGGWPVVELAAGERTALNPNLTDIRLATEVERMTYHRERASAERPEETT